MAVVKTSVLIFSPFTLDLDRGTLRRGDELRSLRRQSFDVLRVLIARRGETVATDDIVSAVWTVRPARPDASLTQCIKDIRRAFGDGYEWMIRTMPGSGYQFVPQVTVRPVDDAVMLPLPDAPVPETALPGTAAPAVERMPLTALTGEPTSSLAQLADAGAQAAAPSAAHARFSALASPRRLAAAALLLALAVMFMVRSGAAPDPTFAVPLRMMAMPSIAMLPASSSTEEQNGAAFALADEIAAEMRRSPRGYDLLIKAPINQKARDSSPEAAARQLGVRYIVTVNPREQGNARQIVIQLIEGPTGRLVWGAPFIHPIGSLEEQGIMAARIARAIVVQIRSAESVLPLPSRPEAGHYTLQGRALLESERGNDASRRAMVLFDKAHALDPNHVQTLLGVARTRVDSVALGWAPKHAWPVALQEAQAAVDRVTSIDKANVGGHLLRGVIARTQGNFDAALASLEHARSINPNYPFVHAETGLTKILAGQPAESIAHIERALQLSPTDPTSSFWCYWAGMAAAHVGDFKASLEWLLRSQQINPHFNGYRPWLAIAYAKLGDQDRARALVKEHLAALPQFNAAGWQSLLGRGNAPLIARLEPFAVVLRELGAPAGPREK